jgi:DNA-binding LacI/PurR family transcriptional regulator
MGPQVVTDGAGAESRAVAAGPPSIENLGRAPAPSRASLSKQTNSVAVVITEPTTRIFGDPFFSLLLKGVYEALAERSLLAVMIAPQSANDHTMTESYMLRGHFDGVILVSLHGDNQLPNELRKAGIPAVLCGSPARGIVASYVDSDNRHGARMAVEHLVSLGRRRVATISGNLDMTGAVDRLLGYRDAVVAAGMTLDPTMEEVADYMPNRAHMAMERLLLNHPDVDAVFAASDLMAAAAIRVLHQARKRIPEDVAVVGFDDSPTSRATRPQLTSIRQPIEEIGREAVNILLREMQEPRATPREAIFSPELIVRESSAGAAAVD